MRDRWRKSVFSCFIAFCMLLLGVVVFLNWKTQQDSRALLEESVESQLIAICVAAREAINPDEFVKLGGTEDTVNNENYAATLNELKRIVSAVGAKYIYVLSQVNGKYVFVYDTDPEDTAIFIEYDLSPVHAEAFRGRNRADIMNVKDEYGSFSTGAVPLWHNGTVVGVVAADIEDTLIAENRSVGCRNMLLLTGTVCATMLGMAWVLRNLLRRLRGMQDKLELLAHYDAVTGLPNRQYLIEFLDGLSRRADKVPFALLFIDLDNFKKVNDIAGHDAGDALLKRIGAYLGKHSKGLPGDTRVFRPSAGKLNVAARIGGDEFIVVVPHVDNQQYAAEVASNLLGGFRQKAIDNHIQKFNVGMSIGIALYPSQSEDYNVLIKYADIAMYHAKNAGKDTFRIYDDELPDKAEK